MKKLKTVSIVVLSFYHCVSYADMPAGFYLSAKIGGSQQDLKHRTLSSTEYLIPNGEKASDSFGFGKVKKNVFHGGIGIGYNFDPQFNLPIRLEIEYINRRTADQSSYHNGMDFTLLLPNNRDNSMMAYSRIKTQTLMLNGYCDIVDLYSVKPYVFAGVGLAMNRVDYQNDFRILDSVSGSVRQGNQTINKFTWNVGFGVSKALSQNWLVDLEYRFMSIGHISSDTDWQWASPTGDTYQLTANIKGKLQYQSAQMSIRYTF